MDKRTTSSMMAVTFSPGWLSQHVFCVNPEGDVGVAVAHASSMLGYVRDRLSQAVQGDIGDDDESICGDEACVLAFIVSSAKAVLDAIPLPDPTSEEGGERE